MRSGLLVIGFLLLVAGFFWWRHPTRHTPVAHAVAPHSQSFSSSAKTETPPQVSAPKAEPQGYVKAVGAHQGPPIFLKRRENSAEGRDESPMQRYEGLAMSKPIDVNERREVVLGARAIPTSQYNSSYGPVLFEQNGFSVVAIDTTADNDWKDLVVRAGDRPLVINPANAHLGIVTGTLVVKLTDVRQAEPLAGRQNLQLISVDESIHTAYFRAPENYHLLSGAAEVGKDRAVEHVELEIVRGKVEAR